MTLRLVADNPEFSDMYLNDLREHLHHIDMDLYFYEDMPPHEPFYVDALHKMRVVKDARKRAQAQTNALIATDRRAFEVIFAEDG